MYTILCGKVLWQTFQSQNCSNSKGIMNGPQYTHTLSQTYAISSFCNYTNAHTNRKENWVKTLLTAHQASPCGNESTVRQRWQKNNAGPHYRQWSGHAVTDEVPACSSLDFNRTCLHICMYLTLCIPTATWKRSDFCWTIWNITIV